MKILGVIPARYASTRFPGKPLEDILGKSMIQRVYEQASKAKSLDRVFVATDDQRIFDHVKGFGGKVVFTKDDHLTGTSRLLEVAARYKKYDAYINIQGDEPFIHPNQINQVGKLLKKHEGAFVATLAKAIQDLEMMDNPNAVKVVMDKGKRALYFSRAPIPYFRNKEKLADWLNDNAFYKHIGIYGYSKKALKQIRRLKPSPIEQAESLEQLTWLFHGIPIHVGLTTHEAISIDTPDDLERLLREKVEEMRGD